MSVSAEVVPNNDLINKLQKSSQEIRLSYLHDIDKTEEMVKIQNFIQNILDSNESIEHNLEDNEETFKFFIGTFLKDVISNITIQNIVYGNNGDEIAVDLLYHIYELFLKFHKNTKYNQLFEIIREIIKPETSLPNFFKPFIEQRINNQKIENKKRRYNSSNFNKLFYKDCMDNSKSLEKIYKIGDKVDVLIASKKSRQQLDKRAWVRGEVESIDEENMLYIVHCEKIDEKIKIQMGGGEITKVGEKTKDWDWRNNLKEYDIIDCYDRSKWYPSTVTKILEGGLRYHIGFRLYPKHFKNENDEKDTIDNYKCFWSSQNYVYNNDKKEEYLGDAENYDEDIDFFSKRIQKFQSYTNTQKNFLDTPVQYYARGHAVKSDIKNEIQKMNYELENDEVDLKFNDDSITYELNGKKNYIIGKTNKFNYYYALFWKKLADNNAFEDFIEIINNKPNAEEIYMILYTIYCAMPYLHKQYLIDNLDNFKNATINFINNLETKDIRNLPKNLTEIINKFLKNIGEILISNNNCEDNTKDKDEENKKNISNTIDEISLRLSIKMLKTSIFDKRMQGIKSLNEFISDKEKKEESMNTLINLIQKNEIIKEIFGSNYHSQIISKSNKILSLLLKNNEIKEEDIKLIWDCTQRGDLEVKNIIMKLLSDLAGNLNEKFINILLENIINKVDENKMNEQDIDFIYNLSIHGDNENNKKKCMDYLYQCILKIDLNNENDIKNNSIMNKLLTFAQNDEKYLGQILSMCESDLKNNNNSLIILEIFSIFLDKYTIVVQSEIIIMKDTLKDFIQNESLLNLYKDNFMSYIQRIKEQIKSKNITANCDDEILDNYTHIINVKKRIEFLNKWITVLYPAFDFVPFLKNLLLNNPVSKNDEIIFDEFIQKYISESSANENQINKEKKENMKSQLFKNYIENDQSNMTFSEFKLFISIFLGMNSSNICYVLDSNDNYDIKLSCQSIDEIKDLDKLWNIIYQIKDEKVLNKAISIIFNIYKSTNEIEKLLHKCKELIIDDNNVNINEVINKCFKLLKMIILESEKNAITKTKSHFNLLKNCYVNLPLKIVPKYQNNYYYNNNSQESNANNNKKEIVYGNTTINELKELLIEKERFPFNTIEIYLSKEYTKDNEQILDDIYNNKSIMEILEQNYKQDLPLDKIFLFYHKNMEKESLLINNEFNPKLERILKEWFAEFTKGEKKMDMSACSDYISKVTGVREITSLSDSRVTQFFKQYDQDNTGYITEDKFLEFYMDALRSNREETVWDNLKAMGIREDLHSRNEPYPIPFAETTTLPRYRLGNDKNFVQNLFNLFNKCNKKNEIFEFLFFLSTNEEMYDEILNNLNTTEADNFKKIFEEKKNLLQSLYSLIIIESILQDINIDCTDSNFLKNNFTTNENGAELIIEFNSKKYEHFDDIDMNIKRKFLKDFILNKNYKKLFNYMNDLLSNFTFDNEDTKKNKENLILNLCCEKCLNIINIIYNATKEKNSEKEIENTLPSKNNNNILPFDYNDLFNCINDDTENIKKSIEQINLYEYTKNLIKFIDNINKNLTNEDSPEKNSLLQNSFSLLINLISNNDKLITEIFTNTETKANLENLMKSVLNMKNEKYKIFYINCLLNSIKHSKKDSSNKFLNLLFELTNDIIFNRIMKDDSLDNNNFSNESTLIFDFFSVLTSKLDDNIGNEFLYQIYKFLFDKLEQIEEEGKNIPKDIYIGLMNLLIKKIKYNKDIKNIIINKEIKGKTLLDLILEIFYKNINNQKEKKEEEKNINTNDNNNKEIDTNQENVLINLDTTFKPEAISSKKEIPIEIKEICSQYIIECFRFSSDEKILNKILSIIKIFSAEKTDEQKSEELIKKNKSPPSFKKHGYVGLKNLGCICYMNSILQQVYMVPTFRYAIMGFNDTNKKEQEISDDDSLNQLQIMYTYLTLSEKEDYNPKNFCKAFKDFDGNPINIMVQQDSQEFFNNFFDKMENNLKKSKYKYIINDVFVGRTCSSVICDSCKHVSNRFEDFYNLTLEVKNINNLNDSLHKLITPEKIEDFKCSNCNKNVTINKRTSLSDLPNILVFHLKRFYMNYEIERTEKINSRFEFPLNINMKEFCIEDIDFSGKKFESEDIYIKNDNYYEYELKGINIHMGSADGGHYFSVINIKRNGKGNILEESDKNQWLKFNDSHISIFDINDIEKESFGGSTKGGGFNYENFQNAYMLIYERKNKTPIRYRYDEPDFNKLFDAEKEQNNIIKINNENRAKIKKIYNLAKKDEPVNEDILYQKFFFDEDKKEYYKYIPFYSIEKLVPKNLYEQVMEKNEELLKQKNKENEGDNHKKDFYDILINNIDISEFNINNYTEEIQCDFINILIPEMFPTDQYLYEEEKKNLNIKAKLILEHIILAIVEKNINVQMKEGEENKSIKVINTICKSIIEKERLKRIYTTDFSAIFDKPNIEIFSNIIKSLIDIYYVNKKSNKYLSIIESLMTLIQQIDANDAYRGGNNTNANLEETPLFYIYKILYDMALKEEKVAIKLINQSCISELLGKLLLENKKNKNIIFDIVIYLLKYLDDYNEELFDLKGKIKEKKNINFFEKHYLIKNISRTIIELLFNEKLDLLIILIKLLQNNEPKFSQVFNSQNLLDLFIYSTNINKISDMNKILFGILEINDQYTINRLNYILGYPTLVIKDSKNKNEIPSPLESQKNILYDEEEKKEDETSKEKKVKYQWPLFGERLIQEKGNAEFKLKRHIYKYISYSHEHVDFCLLSRLMPEIDEDGQIVNYINRAIPDKERKDLIYDLFKLMLLGRGNYCVFKYIYLSPSRCIFYNNLYEEMLDILEQENKSSKEGILYDLVEIKKNAEICIKKIEAEVDLVLKYLKDTDLINDEIEFKLPDMMQKYYINVDDVDKFIGSKPNFIPGDVIKEKIVMLTNQGGLFLIRLEYITEFKTQEEIRNNLLELQKTEKEKKDKDKEQEKKEIVETQENNKNEETKQEKKEDNKQEDDNESIDSDTDSNEEIELTEINHELDKKQFLREVLKKYLYHKGRLTITNPDKKNIKGKSSLIRFQMLNITTQQSPMQIQVNQKDIPDDVRENYYYQHTFWDLLKAEDASNFLNIYRLRNDLPFLKKEHIGINVNIKRNKEFEE